MILMLEGSEGAKLSFQLLRLLHSRDPSVCNTTQMLLISSSRSVCLSVHLSKTSGESMVTRLFTRDR